MQLYLAAAPCCLGNAARWGLPLLHAAYGVEESRLTSLTLPAHVQGGFLLLTGPETPLYRSRTRWPGTSCGSVCAAAIPAWS